MDGEGERVREERIIKTKKRLKKKWAMGKCGWRKKAKSDRRLLILNTNSSTSLSIYHTLVLA